MLNGLVLAGGYSRRMKRDKGGLLYHGMTQREYCYNLLTNICQKKYISCREEQLSLVESGLPVITDCYPDAGPMGALLSAFHQNSSAAWLVIACDMPFLNNDILQYLVNKRNPSLVATYFLYPDSAIIEPLCTIYEPSIYPILQNKFTNKDRSLRRVLKSLPAAIISPPDIQAMININTPEEYERIRRLR